MKNGKRIPFFKSKDSNMLGKYRPSFLLSCLERAFKRCAIKKQYQLLT